jgi:hypothetical protein
LADHETTAKLLDKAKKLLKQRLEIELEIEKEA